MPPLDIFRALADSTRFRIVTLLRSMELAVGELAQVLGQSQPRVSRHIRILCDAGLARRRREGSWVFLTPGDPRIVNPLFEAIDRWESGRERDHWAVADAARLAAVRADRAAAAARYFAEHAQEWDAIRSLHAADAHVEAAILDVMGDAPIGRMVDIGTGTGRMIELFGSRASHVTGIDRSPEMLRLARAKLAETPLANWELEQGDLTRLERSGRSADTVILHQVLHFIPAPEVAIAQAARLIDDEGRLLIVDFAPHDIESLRSDAAHARLGFSDEQIAAWFAAAGLAIDDVRAVPGGELTVKLWRGVRADQPRAARPQLKVIAA